MPWELEIHIIDVGQGESSLIIARNTAAPQRRTMLIDGGLAGYAETVHTYVTTRLTALGIARLDHILVSHYDGDHSGGITALLIADNLYRLCEILAQAAGDAAFDAANNGHDQDHQVAAAAAAVAAAAMGGYDDGAGNNRSNIAVNAGRAAWGLVITPGATYAEIVRDAAPIGENTARRSNNANVSILPVTNTRRNAAKAAGIAAGAALGNAANRTAAALTDVFAQLKTTVNSASRFETGGIYHNVGVIDTGASNLIPGNYVDTINGRLTLSGNNQITLPGINRQRTSAPNLGREVLWNSGPNAMAAPANSPAIFVVACNKYIWRAPNNSVPISGAIDNNPDSIGLILRFNRFFYYTGGDLPTEGEDLIATAVMNNGLPDPQNPPNAFPTPHRIACFKCGHHGSEHSTSNAFLNTTRARGAFISCGDKPFGRTQVTHPTQQVINRLHGAADIQYFYLTNCRYQMNHVPASQNPPLDQLTAVGNKSRLAGDNDDDNLAVGRQRGDIRIHISEAESTSNITAGPLGIGQVLRQYHVRYYDADSAVQNFRVEDTIF